MTSADRIDFEMEVEVESASSGPPVDVPNPTSPAPPTPGGNKSVVVTTATAGSVTVSLHPLVIMNVSEHWTRLRAQEGSPQTVVGALIGKQKGRNIEVMNSFELVFSAIDGDIVIDREYYNLKEEQFKQVFSDMDFLGWYTTGEAPTERDIAVHRQICDINECPVMLMLNPAGVNGEQLPVVLYESVIDVVNGRATMLLAPLTYTLAAEEAERIGVDHVARVSSGEAALNSLVAEHLTAQRSAIKMLVSRVRAVLATVRAIRDGSLPPRPTLLREARALANRLPLLTSQQFRTHFYNQCNDVALMTYLGTITKGCNGINQLVNRFNVLYDRQGMGRRMRGLFF
ncbi:PREDICTED: COP9 signalosome complex subunit 6 [Papilio polytes]|uniref:COP9 signalosome complex subunit 6 n=1 Tax=Papilio polytes TaxID=76194 RepID=UPI0006763B52|nr:PREDICTED: COP9 signalosome complex subunit 6 [Papilio polytes]